LAFKVFYNCLTVFEKQSEIFFRFLLFASAHSTAVQVIRAVSVSQLCRMKVRRNQQWALTRQHVR